MKSTTTAFCLNKRIARQLWPSLSKLACRELERLTIDHDLSVAAGDVILLDGRWYTTHTGLLRLAHRNQCFGIQVQIIPEFSDPKSRSWAFQANVYKSKCSRVFVGFGDADPSNVSPLVRGAEMRVAETRAVNRALRKAYGIGICSVEELGTHNGNGQAPAEAQRRPPQPSNGNSWATGPRVRDRLCQLIRQHQLDPDLVKAYAIDFCGTKTLKDATRAQVENFVAHLADCAETDRNALLCQLNSYFRVKEHREPKNEGAA